MFASLVFVSEYSESSVNFFSEYLMNLDNFVSELREMFPILSEFSEFLTEFIKF